MRSAEIPKKEAAQTLSPSEVSARKFAATLSLVVGILILLAKFWAHNITNSQAAYSDAMESIVNVLTAGLSLFVIYYSALPLDEDHPYGHGKVEYFSSAFEGGLIFFAAFFILYGAVRALIQGNALNDLSEGTLILAVAGTANLFLGFYLKAVGKKNRSPALIASGEHVVSDFWTSAAVVVSLITVQFSGLEWLDIFVAFAAGGYLAWTGIKLIRVSISGLMDEEDVGLLKELAAVFERHAGQGIIQIHHVRIIRAGWFHHIDAHMVVPEFWQINEAHEKLDEFEKQFIEDYSYSGEANFHLDPCRRNYCSSCDLPACPIRLKPFEKRQPIEVSDLRSFTEPGEKRARKS